MPVVMVRAILRCMLALYLVSAAGCSKGASEPAQSGFKPAAPKPADPGPAKLEIADDVVGKGAEAKSGDTVRVHYTGTLMNGTKFDSSRDRGTPFDFKLGTNAVIKGWDEGVVGMKVGGKRRLTIPQSLAYGEEGRPPEIPAKAGLKFDIELLDVNPKDSQASGSPPDMPPESEEGFDPSNLPNMDGEDEAPE
jgi:FKBP-type peptidyl-prolyl cis-trans isomerase FkpA